MNETRSAINDLLLKTFCDILNIEESVLKQGVFNDLTISEMHTIEAIGLHGRRTMSQAARELSVTVGTLTVAVSSLVRKSYAERFRVEEDRRFVKVGLSSKGRLAFRAHEKFHADMIGHMVNGLTEEEERILASSLGKLNGFLQDFQKHVSDKAGGGA